MDQFLKKDYRQDCKYGGGCYQKNPAHKAKFKHPEDGGQGGQNSHIGVHTAHSDGECTIWQKPPALFVIFSLITREKLYRVVRRRGKECMF